MLSNHDPFYAACEKGQYAHITTKAIASLELPRGNKQHIHHLTSHPMGIKYLHQQLMMAVPHP